jgi:predicted metal-binding membrane protein
MNLRWVTALTILVTAEKLLPGARFWRLAIGVGLIATSVGFGLAGWRAA